MNLSVRQRYITLAVLGAALVVGTVANEVLRSRSAAPLVEVEGVLGPTPGPDAEGYIAGKRAYLDRLGSDEPSTPAASLVSFSRMLTAAEASGLIADRKADAVFLRFPGTEAEATRVTGGLEATVQARAESLIEVRTEEIEQLEQRLASAAPDDLAELESSIAERRTWIEQMQAGCSCVYAAVVVGSTAGSLRELAGHADVRLADVPDPAVADLRGWELRPILPPGS